MEPYQYLQQASVALDTLDSSEEINKVIDELEFIFELLDPEHQNLAEDLMSRFNARLKTL